MTRARAPLAVASALLVVLLVAQAGLLGRLLHSDPFFDEGTYLLSLDALRHGQVLGQDVFASQPPGFYDLLRVLAVVFPVSLSAMRAAMIASVLVGTLAGFVLGRRLAGWGGALGAVAFLVIAPPLPLYGARIFADTPALALGACALAASAFVTIPAALVAGAVLLLAVSVKLSALTVAPAIVAFLLCRPDRWRALGAAAGGAAVVLLPLVAVHWGSLSSIWHQAISYHVTAGAVPGGLANGSSFTGFFNPRTPFFWLLLVGAVGTVFSPRRVWLPWLWSATATVFVLTHHPLHENHLLTLPFAFAIPAGIGAGAGLMRVRSRSLRLASISLLVLALAAGWLQQLHRVDTARTPLDPRLTWATDLLDRHTRPEALVVSDEPMVPFLAHRRVPGELVDTAILRFETGSLTDAAVEATIERDDVRAVVAGRSFRTRPMLMRWIVAHFPDARTRGGVSVRFR